MKPSGNQATQGQLIAAVIAIAIILAATAVAWLWIQKQSPLPEESRTEQPFSTEAQPSSLPTPTPTPRAIPHGKWGFGISTSQPGPKPGRGYLDPYDPSMGGKQTITLYVADEQGVQSVTAIVKTDNKVHPPIQFKRINGSDLAGEWEGGWIVDDTYLYTYAIIFEAKSPSGVTKVESTFR